MRYVGSDDFGLPETAFLICRFWLIGALWGNFPQTYSMAGLLPTAMRLSRSWEDRYWRSSS
jgi:hypothetical protein